MEEIKDTVAEEVANSENLDAETAERLRKFREAEEKAKLKEEEKALRNAEKEAKVKAKLELDMQKHYARKAKHDEWKAARDAKRIERDRIDKEKADAKKEAKRVYYTQAELGELLANRHPVMLEKGQKKID